MTGSQGYLLHAFNSDDIDYATMAVASALLLKKTLRTNATALITSRDTIDWARNKHGSERVSRAFDDIIVIDKDLNVGQRLFHDTRYSSKKISYYNKSRASSFDLSPFHETMLIDTDYMILDTSMDLVWGSVEDIMINKTVRDLCHNVSPPGFDARFNELSVPLYWATCMYFRKTKRAKAFFDLWSFVKDNYGYYQSLYDFAQASYFRNDYAMSIALHLMGGHMENESVKSLPMAENLTATEFDDLIDFVDGNAYFMGEAEQGSHRLHKVSVNVHVMNKQSMVRMHERIISYAES